MSVFVSLESPAADGDKSLDFTGSNLGLAQWNGNVYWWSGSGTW